MAWSLFKQPSFQTPAKPSSNDVTSCLCCKNAPSLQCLISVNVGVELAVKDPHKLVIVGTTRRQRLKGFDDNIALLGSVDTVQELSDL